MKRLIISSCLCLGLLVGCEKVEADKIIIEVKDVECSKGNRFSDVGCTLTDSNDRVYQYGKELYYVKEGIELEIEVKGFNQIESIRYIDSEVEK